MPTGYTYKVKDGQSFEDFVWGGARGMGALIMMRDDPADAPIPERFEPSDWHTKQLAEARAELTRLEALTPAQAAMEAEAAHISAVDYWQKGEVERIQTRDAYEAMLQRVDAWQAPSSHAGFKDFMRSQLTESMEFDTGHQIEKPKAISGEEWMARRLENVRKDIAYHEKMHAEEVARTEERNRWLSGLRASIAPPKR